jgi:pimeloyl-ACP methyl ester carboxylesterase
VSWRTTRYRPASPGRNQALLALSRVVGESRGPVRHTAPRGPVRDNDNTRQLQHEFLQADVTAQLPNIEQPTLVLYGERDAIATAGAPRFTRLQHVEFKALPGVGHEVFEDAPTLALGPITAFLTEGHPRA